MICSVCKRDFATIPYGLGCWQCQYCGAYDEHGVIRTKDGALWGSYKDGQRYDATGKPVDRWHLPA